MLQFYQPLILEFSKTERIPQLDHYYSIGTAAVFSCILTRLENRPFRTDCLTGFFNGDMMVIVSCAYSIETLLRVVFICSSSFLSLIEFGAISRVFVRSSQISVFMA